MKRLATFMASLWLGLSGLGGPRLRAAENANVPVPPPGDLISQGQWWLYHLQYEKAHQMFDRYSAAHPQDPAGFFYKAATDWWQLAQQFDYKLPDVETRFEQDYQDTVRLAKAYEASARTDKERAYADLYWGGAEGLKGRWLVTQKQWVKAYFLGKRGAKLLKRAVTEDPSLADAYLGLGIYDYFTDTLPGVVGALSALLIHGDKHRGLKELQWAIDKGAHARVEAMFFLIEIYTSEEDTPAKALPIARQLRAEFPASPAMHLAEVMTLYTMKDWEPMMVEAESYLEKSEGEVPWFRKEGVRPALYCLGTGELWGRHNIKKAAAYFDRILAAGIDPSRWVTFALLRRGQIYDEQNEHAKAQDCYRQVIARPDFWGSHKEGRRYLKDSQKN